MLSHYLWKIRNHKLITLQVVLLVAISLVLRLVNLGYSNLQGDEILTLCRFSDYETPLQFLAYLLGRLKGPAQYLITCAVSLFDPAFSSELVLRLPFAIANLLAIACFFLLAQRLFTFQIAIHASFLLAANGIFIAFARIVQYQSFVILGGVAGILCLVMALEDEKWRVRGLYAGSLFATMGLLAHFDAAFFLPPMLLLVLHWWLNFHDRPDFARLRMHLIAAGMLFAFLVLGFYLEYALHLHASQLIYWENRRTGDSTNIFRLFQFYNPGPVLWICLGWILLSLTQMRRSLAWQVVLSWFLPPLIFMVLIFKDSRTHAYTYLLPLFIVVGIGIDAMTGWLQARFRGRSFGIVQTAVLTTFLIFSYISYQIFIDHAPEYPWHPKRVLGMKFDGGFVSGTFGFPYAREWRDIGRWFEELPGNEQLMLVTNEKRQFVSFYLPSNVRNRLKYTTGNFPGDVYIPEGVYILIVQAPQSWTRQLWGVSLGAWHEEFVPLHDFLNEEGEIVASVYFFTQQQIETEFH
ncbi:MAG TPA: glycosyltransferase family 39 protein [Anaerolineales bacterium]|nr:glycosyltransferase family 39 protein [Anaerolineales bacterium]